jgi:hypothetical protein
MHLRLPPPPHAHHPGFIRLNVLIILLMVVIGIGAGSGRAQNVAPATAPAPIGAQVVKVPLIIDYLALSAAIRQQLFIDHGRMPLWNGSDQCQYLYAENPRFSRGGDNVKLEADGSLMIGAMVGSTCVSPIAWKGIIEAETLPYMGPNLQLKFRITDVNLYDQQHQKTLLAGRGFDLIKENYIPQIQTFTFDLSPAFHQFEDLIKAGAPTEVAERVSRTLASLRAEPELRAEDDGVRATLDFAIPQFAPVPTPSGPPAQLTPQELAAFETQIDQWDSFLVFAVKQMGESSTDAQLRQDLLALLLDSRYRLIQALANPQAGGPDPIRLLFLDEWQRLGQVIREAAQRGVLGSQSLQFLSFISAGDALFTLDQMAPALGMRISADDLRRLARMIGPTQGKDPLGFSFDEDPELRKMFNLKEPLSSEGPLDTESEVVETPIPNESPSSEATGEETGEATGEATPEAMPSATNAMPSAAASPLSASPAIEETPPATPSAPLIPPMSIKPDPSTSLLQLPFWILSPREADAAEIAPTGPDTLAKLQDLATKLKRLVVSGTNAAEYRGDYDQLLQYGAQRELDEENVDPHFRPIYLKMVKATAWQESCWRQFIIDNNRITYLESSTHDIGVMQVNKYVWRGFYNISRLEWDVLYNSTAGMQILARLLDDLETRRGAFNAQNPDEIARSVYAAYNGGPGAYRRWRTQEAKTLRVIDTSFWEKYRSVQRGNQIDILTCAQDWGHEH